MKTFRKVILLFLGSIIACPLLAEDIECPDAEECFDCWVEKIAPNKVKFKFTRSPVPGHNWTPIEMVAATSTPIANTKKATPHLDVRSIEVAKNDSGDWVIICKYSESGKYGGHVGYTPLTTLTIKANLVKSCILKDARTVSCN